jgi:hypothetical protein
MKSAMNLGCIFRQLVNRLAKRKQWWGGKYVVGEIGVHNDHKVASRKLKAVDVRRSKAQLAFARLQHDAVGPIDFDELLCNLLRAVGGFVIDNDEFPI